MHAIDATSAPPPRLARLIRAQQVALAVAARPKTEDMTAEEKAAETALNQQPSCRRACSGGRNRLKRLPHYDMEIKHLKEKRAAALNQPPSTTRRVDGVEVGAIGDFARRRAI